MFVDIVSKLTVVLKLLLNIVNAMACCVFKCVVLLTDTGYERLQKEKTGPCFGLTALSH